MSLALRWSTGSTTGFLSKVVRSRGGCPSHCNFYSSSSSTQLYHGFLNPQGWPLRIQSDDPLLIRFRWLLSHGHNEQALDVISRIEAKPADDPYIITQYNEIEYSINYERENAVSWTDLLLRRQKTNDTKTLRRILLGAGTQALQQFQGMSP
jgi:hypothetical protein